MTGSFIHTKLVPVCAISNHASKGKSLVRRCAGAHTRQFVSCDMSASSASACIFSAPREGLANHEHS